MSSTSNWDLLPVASYKRDNLHDSNKENHLERHEEEESRVVANSKALASIERADNSRESSNDIRKKENGNIALDVAVADSPIELYYNCCIRGKNKDDHDSRELKPKIVAAKRHSVAEKAEATRSISNNIEIDRHTMSDSIDPVLVGPVPLR